MHNRVESGKLKTGFILKMRINNKWLLKNTAFYTAAVDIQIILVEIITLFLPHENHLNKLIYPKLLLIDDHHP